MEQSCNEVRKMREDINRFKIVIETAFKACEEYNLTFLLFSLL